MEISINGKNVFFEIVGIEIFKVLSFLKLHFLDFGAVFGLFNVIKRCFNASSHRLQRGFYRF